MRWAFLDRWQKHLRLEAVTPGERYATTARIRDAFSAASADITDVHFFSGVLIVFTFEIGGHHVRALRESLAAAGLKLDAQSLAALEVAATATGDVHGTLAVTFSRGDPDLKHEVPSVPG